MPFAAASRSSSAALSIALALMSSVGMPGRGGLRHFHQLLAEILAFQKADERARRVLEALGHGLTVFDLAAAHAVAQLFQRFGPALHVVGDDEALQLDAHPDRSHQILDAVA